MAVVFVYGTLTDPERVSTLLEEYTFGPSAVCYGLRRADGQYPTLLPGEQVTGRLLATPEMSRLDRYEGLDRGLYCRRSVPLHIPPGCERDSETSPKPTFTVDTAFIYIGHPKRVGLGETPEWPGSGNFEHRVDGYLGSSEVRIELERGRKQECDDP